MNEHKRKLTELERKAGAGKRRIVVHWAGDEVPEAEDDEELVIIRVVYADTGAPVPKPRQA